MKRASWISPTVCGAVWPAMLACTVPPGLIETLVAFCGIVMAGSTM